MKASILNPQWKYVDSEKTKKPGYLKRKFEKIRREQAQKPENVIHAFILKKAGK